MCKRREREEKRERDAPITDGRRKIKVFFPFLNGGTLLLLFLHSFFFTRSLFY